MNTKQLIDLYDFPENALKRQSHLISDVDRWQKKRQISATDKAEEIVVLGGLGLSGVVIFSVLSFTTIGPAIVALLCPVAAGFVLKNTVARWWWTRWHKDKHQQLADHCRAQVANHQWDDPQLTNIWVNPAQWRLLTPSEMEELNTEMRSCSSDTRDKWRVLMEEGIPLRHIHIQYLRSSEHRTQTTENKWKKEQEIENALKEKEQALDPYVQAQMQYRNNALNAQPPHPMPHKEGLLLDMANASEDTVSVVAALSAAQHGTVDRFASS